jgi:hypothetical protein
VGGRCNLITSTKSLNNEVSQTQRQKYSFTVALIERALVESRKMYQVSRQFNGIESQKKEPPTKIKYSGGGNPYAYLNHMIDYQIKQAKLEELYKKTKEFCPPQG